MKHLPLRSPEYRQTLHDFTQWIATLGYAPSSVYGLPIHIREFFHFLEELGITTLNQATATHVEQFIHYLSERRNQRRGGGLSPSHINKYIQALKLLAKFVQATGQGYLPVEVKRHKVPRHIEIVLRAEEVQALYLACPDTPIGLRDRAMLSLYYGCGLRRSEGVGLDVGDVLTRRKLLYVRKGKNYVERYVPINAAIIQDLQTYLHEARPILLGKQYTPALLVSERGRRVQGLTLSLRLRELRQRAGMEYQPITLHTLRHSIATHLLQSGMSLQDIARFLGHRSLEATQIYTHLGHEDTR